MAGEISKEQLDAMLEVQTKSAAALEKIANSFNDITSVQDKLIDMFAEVDKKMSNGLCDKVVSKVDEKMSALVKPLAEKQQSILNNTEDIQGKATAVSVVIGAAALVIIIAVVVVRVLTTVPHALSKDEMVEIMRDEMINFHREVK